jgi:L-seryl-tRNA(Ser) seleniumtransferase
MSIYQRFGVQPIIDCAGTSRFGGILLSEEVLAAMDEAAKEVVRLDELQAAASRLIARVTGAEAGIVTSGAFAGLTLAAAACIAGLDVGRMNRLPETSGMPNEILMAGYQMGSYERAVRIAGARIVAVDVPNQLYAPSLNYIPEPWEFDAAVSERTAAVLYITYRGDVSRPPLEQLAQLAHKHNLPVIVDAATAVPPVENLRKYISMGVDLVTISGGKGLHGPKASGLLFGRRDLIASAALQSMEMASITFEGWDPPETLIPKSKLRGLPQQGIGRGMMATKEAIAGLLVALELFTPERAAMLNAEEKKLLETVAGFLKGIAGVTLEWTHYNPESRPQLKVRLDSAKARRTVGEVTKRLRQGTPRIYVRGDPTVYATPEIPGDVLIVNGFNLNPQQADVVGRRLREALT